jgi:hypothetical protein
VASWIVLSTNATATNPLPFWPLFTGFELKRMSSATSDHSEDLSSFSVHSDSNDDDSSLEREEYRSKKRRRLVALVAGYILLKRKKRLKIPSSARGGLKKRTA